MSNIVELNDQLGSSDLKNILVLVVAGAGIVEFKGESISPVCRVVEKNYTKNGKWSHTTYSCQLQANAWAFKFSQTARSGYRYFPEGAGWSQGIRLFREAMDASRTYKGLQPLEGITDEMIKLFIRASMPLPAANMDAADQKWSAGDQMTELLKAQEELASAKAEIQSLVDQMEADEEVTRLKEQASKLRGLVDRSRKGTISLADLKAALSQ